MTLQGKKILLGVCGSIAAYKSAFLIRLLVKEGAEVQVVMTPSAPDFISELTLSTLSNKPVYKSFLKNQEGEWVNHVELGLWADLVLVAPATANTIAKFAQGICDNLLASVYLSAKCPVWIAPAMDLDMYKHPATRANLDKLKSYGNTIIDSEYGELASGLVGEGRLAEPEHIAEKLKKHFSSSSGKLSGKKVLITAGPTYEAIDPVRFIGNHSTGKMGYELAVQAAAQGAQVILVSGPSAMPKPSSSSVQLIKVTAAQEMYEQVAKYFPETDIAIMAAAVADYTPKNKSTQKIKKKEEEFSIELVKNVDIARELGKTKTKQFIVGFALETNDEIENAKAKILSKNFDMIVLNSLNDAGAGFGTDTNKITLIDKHNKTENFGLKNKTEVAKDILEAVIKRYEK